MIYHEWKSSRRGKKQQRILEQRAHEQLMISMMQNIFQVSNVQPQRPTTVILPYPPATTVQVTTQAPSASQTDDLVNSMEKTNLNQTSDESMKRLKTGDFLL